MVFNFLWGLSGTLLPATLNISVERGEKRVEAEELMLLSLFTPVSNAFDMFGTCLWWCDVQDEKLWLSDV